MSNKTPQLFKISFEDRPEYLYALIKGDTSKSVTKIECWGEIITRCRKDGRHRLLVVLDGPGNATELDAYESTRGIIALGLQGLKIAYVDLNPENHKNNQFGELVAGNRGVFAKVFTTEPEAEQWLTKEGR